MKQPLVILLIILCSVSWAQVPQGMNYQAVVHDNAGNIIPNHAIGIKFNIRQGTTGGAIVYSETHAVTSDQFGGIALVIGNGAVVSGNFSAINWATGTYFNEVLLDVTGGTSYVSMGTSQLMSVPYALYAKSAGGLSNGTTNNYGYVVKFNGVAISDSSINDLCTGTYAYGLDFLTETNHRYSLRFGTNVRGTPFVWTNDTILLSTIYLSAGEMYNGSIILTDNLPADAYYQPFNAIQATVPAMLWEWNSTYWKYSSTSPQNQNPFYQIFPNNPTITGFNLTLPVNVTIERQ